MKVLFAMSDVQVSEKIAEKYYEKYSEKIESKNVFYFKALLNEVKNDKTYDRIVISEDIQQAITKNVDQFDRDIFSYIDKITDEIEDSELIIICSDRRRKENDEFIARLFNIGVYNMLIGDDRNFSTLCDRIKKPMNKKEAKRYLHINPINTSNSISSDDENVDEDQIMRVRKYFEETLRGKPDEYLPSFDRVAEQYSRNQLKVIFYYLPLEVKPIILKADRYKFLNEDMEQNSGNTHNSVKENKTTINKPAKKGLFGILKENKGKQNISNGQSRTSNKDNDVQVDVMPKVQVVPKTENISNMPNESLEVKAQRERDEKLRREAEEREKKLLEIEKEKLRQEALAKEQAELRQKAEQEALAKQQAELRQKAEQEALAKEQAELKQKAEQEALAKEQAELKQKAEQEALAKEQAELRQKAEQEALAKQQAELKQKAEQEALAKEQAELRQKAEQEALAKAQAELRQKAEQEALARQQAELKRKAEAENKRKAEQERLEEERRKIEQERLALEEEKKKLRQQSEQLSKTVEKTLTAVNENATQYVPQQIDYKKMVLFVGANKTGTTFLVNAIAHNLADKGIKTGILDMTKGKSMYYIYNQDDEGLRKIASECMQKLMESIDSFIPAEKNLKVYTSVPGDIGDTRKSFRNKAIIDTVKNSNSMVIIDADFTTPLEYYEKADTIYIVQDLDIMRIQEITSFLRELKNRSVDMNKIKVIINKYLKTSVTPKRLIDGLSCYVDPQMLFVDEIFDKKVPYFTVPFEVENYINYIDGMAKNSISYKKCTPNFINAIEEVSVDLFKRGGEISRKKKGLFW